MFRILQLHKSIRRITPLGNNVAKITTTKVQSARFYSSTLAAVKEETQSNPSLSLQNALMEIQRNLKRWGNISNRQAMELSDCVLNSDNVNSTQALAVIRCFTELSNDMTPEQRINNVHRLWAKLEQLCVHLEVGHYNALLRAYLDSEHNFSPTDFLAKMAENGVGPNRVTYQFLVERYCQTGDVDGATRILKFMEEKDVPITQGIMNLMIMGYARNNDMEGAEKVMDTMKSKGLNPDEGSYGILLAEYGRKGDVAKVVDFFKSEKNRDVFLDSRSIANIIYELIINGHEKSVPQVLEAAPAIVASEFHRLIHRLVNNGHASKCFALLDQATSYDEAFIARLQNFVVGRCAQKAKTVEEWDRLKSFMPESESSAVYLGALRSILAKGDLDAALKAVSEAEEHGLEMRTHMYFPLVVRLAKEDNIKDLSKVIMLLKDKLDREGLYYVYRILRTAGWECRAAIDALMPTRQRWNRIVSQCLFQALIHKEFNEAVTLASIPAKSVVLGGLALTMPTTMRMIPVDQFVTIATAVIARSGTGPASAAADPAAAADAVDADAEAEADVEAETEADTEAASAVPDVADVPQGRSNSVPTYAQLQRYSPQQHADFIVSAVARNLFSADKTTQILEDFASKELGISKEVADKLIAECSSPKVKAALKQLGNTRFRTPEVTTTTQTTRLDILEEHMKNCSDDERRFLRDRRLVALCEANDSRAHEVYKESSSDLQPGTLRVYIRYACNSDTSLGMEMWQKYSGMNGTDLTFINLASKLVEEGKLDDAFKIINDLGDLIRNKPHVYVIGNLLFNLSNSSDERCQNFFKEVKDVNAYVANGQMNILVDRQKLTEAVEFYERNPEKFTRKVTRRLGSALIENEKYELLQRLQNTLSTTVGENESLYQLSLILLHCRKDRQAKRIIELSNQPARLINQVLKEKDLRSLESLLEILPPFHSQKDAICEEVVKIYCDKNDAEKALAMYTRFEHENFTPSEKILIRLKDLFVRCGYQVPFDTALITDNQIPETPTKKVKAPQQAKAEKPAKPAKPAPEQNILLSNPDMSRSDFKELYSKLSRRQKFTVMFKVASKAVQEKDAELLKQVLSTYESRPFSILIQILKTSRSEYVELMEKEVEGLEEMRSAYWFDAFVKGDEKVCEDLWRKYGQFEMIVASYGSRSRFLKGHEQRHLEFMEKINAPVTEIAGPYIKVAITKIDTSPQEAVELLEKKSEVLAHTAPAVLERMRKKIAAKSEDGLLSRFDELVKKYAANLEARQSSTGNPV